MVGIALPAELVRVWSAARSASTAGVALTPERTVTTYRLAAFFVNLFGAGALGRLVERLAGCRPGQWRRFHGLLIGTGFLGFTATVHWLSSASS